MDTNFEPIHIVWLKRDLRLYDHKPILEAINSKKRVILVYVFEDILFKDPHYSSRHFNFIKESIRDINCLLYTSPSPRDRTRSRMPSSA